MVARGGDADTGADVALRHLSDPQEVAGGFGGGGGGGFDAPGYESDGQWSEVSETRCESATSPTASVGISGVSRGNVNAGKKTADNRAASAAAAAAAGSRGSVVEGGAGGSGGTAEPDAAYMFKPKLKLSGRIIEVEHQFPLPGLSRGARGAAAAKKRVGKMSPATSSTRVLISRVSG